MNERDNLSSGEDNDEDSQNQSEDAYHQETFGRMAEVQKKELNLRTQTDGKFLNKELA